MIDGLILNKTKSIAILLKLFFLDSIKSFDELLNLMKKTAYLIIKLLNSLVKNKF